MNFPVVYINSSSINHFNLKSNLTKSNVQAFGLLMYVNVVKSSLKTDNKMKIKFMNLVIDKDYTFNSYLCIKDKIVRFTTSNELGDELIIKYNFRNEKCIKKLNESSYISCNDNGELIIVNNIYECNVHLQN